MTTPPSPDARPPNGHAGDQAAEPQRRDRWETGDGRRRGARGATAEPARPSEDRFHALVRRCRDGIVVIDGHGTIVEWNGAEEAITGIPRSTAMGRPIWEIQHALAPEEIRTPELLGAMRNKVLDGLREGLDLQRTIEEEIQRPDGIRRFIHSNLYGIESGGERLAAGVSRDVTARRQLEAALRESEERFRAMADSAPVLTWVADGEGNNQFVNRACCEYFGRTAEELRASGWRPLLHPDDVGWCLAAFQESIRERKAFQVQVRVRRRDGEWRWLELYGAIRLPTSGEPPGMVGIGADVTARKQAEESLERSRQDLRHAQAVARVGSWRFSVHDSVLEWSDETYRMFGIAQGTPMTYAGFLAAVHPDDREAVARSWQEALRGERYDIEHRIVVGDDVKWVREVAHLEYGPDGTLAGGFGTVQDVTDRKALEHALADASRRKDEFLAVLSHELRNPLAPVRSSLHVLARAEPGGEQARRMLSIIERQVSHVARLVDDLLDVARISRGKIQLQRDRVELGDLVRRTVEDHRATVAASGLHLDGRFASSPMWLTADATRIAQVVGNLLANAAKFTPEGGRVEVDLGREGAAAVLRVRDTGVGISREMLQRVFEPFTQADGTLDRARGGLGLGLALVKALVELHGGTVAVASEGPGHGAEFTVRLPLDSAEAGAVRREARRVRPRRVLIIEDDEDAGGSLGEALRLDGHDVQVARDGPEGLAIARGFRPEIVLCDIGLPGMDGYEVARAMRADDALRDSFLVALTGYALPADLIRAGQAGFDRHVAKPPTFEKLEDVLAEAPELPAGDRAPPDRALEAPTA